jgi:hypothetical protein
MPRLVACLLMFALLPNRPASAVEVLDQSWTDTSRDSGVTGFSAEWGLAGQTFTPSTTGLLSRIDVYVLRVQDVQQNPGTLDVSIWGVSGGFPTVAIEEISIPHSTIPPNFHPDWVSIDFSAAKIELTAGEQYAIVLGSSSTHTNYNWLATVDDPYFEGGAAVDFQFFYGEWRETLPERHFSYFFRQYVVVPEPSSIALASLGAVAVLAFRIRRRVRNAV